MQKQLNEQVKNEWESEFIYLTMAAWAYNNNYDGFGLWFIKQAGEEREHGMKILRYLNEADADMIIPSITVPKVEFKDIPDLFKRGLEHEQKVTGMFYRLTELAIAEKDFTTQQFLQWFIIEQLEEEASFRGIIAKLERIKGSSSGLFVLEAKLAERK
jgi:ferritin